MQYKKLYVFLFLALLSGVACSFLVKYLLMGETKPKEPVNLGPMARVLVAKVELSAGNEFSAQNVRFDLVPESIVPRDAIYTTKMVLNRKAASDIPKDAILTLFDVKVEDEKGKNEDSFIPPGYSVVPIQIENVTDGEKGGDLSDRLSLEGVLRSGDKVEISILQSDRSLSPKELLRQGKTPKLVNRSLVSSAVVYNVLTEIRLSDKGAPRRYSIVSLLLDDDSVKLVKKAVNNGRIRLSVLRDEKEGQNGSAVDAFMKIRGTEHSVPQYESWNSLQGSNSFRPMTVQRPVITPASSNNSLANENFSFGIKALRTDPVPEKNSKMNVVSEASQKPSLSVPRTESLPATQAPALTKEKNVPVKSPVLKVKEGEDRSLVDPKLLKAFQHTSHSVDSEKEAPMNREYARNVSDSTATDQLFRDRPGYAASGSGEGVF